MEVVIYRKVTIMAGRRKTKMSCLWYICILVGTVYYHVWTPPTDDSKGFQQEYKHIIQLIFVCWGSTEFYFFPILAPLSHLGRCHRCWDQHLVGCCCKSRGWRHRGHLAESVSYLLPCSLGVLFKKELALVSCPDVPLLSSPRLSKSTPVPSSSGAGVIDDKFKQASVGA